MKKFILLNVIVLLSISCSSDSSESDTNYSINPPSWIIGTWLQVVSTDPIITDPKFKFTSNDFCTIQQFLEICQAESIQLSAQNGGTVNVNEIKTDTEYKLTITTNSVTVNWHFIKINNNKIELVNPTQGMPNAPLIRQ